MEYTISRGMRILPESSWRPVFQRSIDAFYEGEKAAGLAACLTLLNEPGLPDNIRELTFRNQAFYAQPLAALVPGTTWQPLGAPATAGQPAPDPSPAATGDRLVVLRHAGAGDPATGTAPASRALSEGLGEVELHTIRDETTDGQRVSEARPFFADGELHVAALCREPGENGAVRAGVMRRGEDGWEEPRLLGPRAGHFRQGWSPLVTEDGPRFIAWWEPTEVFRLDGETGEFARVALRMAPHLAERFRGGSQGVPVPGGYLFLVNETATFDNGNEVSYSRFVRIDDAFQITDISPQFFLEERGKDVASGLARQGDQLIAGFTSAGSNALLATMEVDPVMAVLMPVDAPGRTSRTEPAG